MPLTKRQVREKFLNSILRGDYTNNKICSAIRIFQIELLEQEVSRPNIPSFMDVYGAGKEKAWFVPQVLGSWDLEQPVDSLETLLELYPELRADISYADFLAKKFGTELQKIYDGREKNKDKQKTEQEIKKLLELYDEMKRGTGGFVFENDKEYQELQEEKTAEISRPQEGERQRISMS